MSDGSDDRPRLHFVVPGAPKPWQRMGSNHRRRYIPAESQAYRQSVQERAQAVLATVPDWPTDKRYRVVGIATVANWRRRDLSNIQKAVEDALNGIVWDDDSQIDDIRFIRRVDAERPGLDLLVEPYEQGEL